MYGVYGCIKLSLLFYFIGYAALFLSFHWLVIERLGQVEEVRLISL